MESSVVSVQTLKISAIDGKVFFGKPDNPQDILTMKCAERAFALTYHGDNSLKFCKGTVIQDICHLLIDKTMWATAMSSATDVWQHDKTQDEPSDSNHGHGDADLSDSNCRHGHDEPETKKARVETERTTFRVSVKCSGVLRRFVNPQMLSRHVGPQLARLMGWRVDLRAPQFEVSINIGQDYITAGIPLSIEPLSKRPYMKDHGLRSTICWIMAHLGKLKANAVVLDPMCGKGTILIEAAKSWPECVYIGSDISQDQLSVAKSNIAHAQVTSAITLLQSSALALPLADESIDVVLCDAPFGQTHKTPTDLREFYTNFLRQIHRIVKKDGRLVLLTSQEMGDYLQSKMAATIVDTSSIHSDVSDSKSELATGKDLTKVNVSTITKKDEVRVSDKNVDTEQKDATEITIGNLQDNYTIFSTNLVRQKCDINTDTVQKDIRPTNVNIAKNPKNEKITISDKNVDKDDVSKSHSKHCSQTSGQTEACKDIVDIPGDTVRLKSETDFAVEISGGIVDDSLGSKDGGMNHSKGDVVDISWNMLEKHYLKLGETHSYVCVLVKQ